MPEYSHVQNCIKCGYELNRIALLLHLFALYQAYNEANILGVFLVVLSYALAHQAEGLRAAHDPEEFGWVWDRAALLSKGCALVTAGAYLVWFIQQFLR